MSDPHNKSLPRLDATASPHYQQGRPQPRRRPCVRWGCIVATTFLVIAVAALVAVRIYIRKSLTPEQWQQVQAVETEVVQLPPDWHKPAPVPPPEAVKARTEIAELTNSVRETHENLLWGEYERDQDLMLILRQGHPVPADKQSSFALFLQDVQPVLEMTSKTVSIPGYTFEPGIFSSDLSNFLAAQTFAKLASITALHKAQEGPCLEAFDLALLPVRYIKRTAPSLTITHLIALAVSAISAHTTYAVSERCSDTLALRYGLDLMTKLRPAAFPGNIENWRYGDTIGALTHAADSGYPVDLSPQTLASFQHQSARVLGGDYHRWVIKNLPASDPRVEAAQAHLESLEKAPGSNESEAGWDTPQGRLWAAATELVMGVDPIVWVHVALAGTNMEEAETRAYTSLAWYDLTRLYIAQRLAKLNAQAAAGAPAASRINDLTAYLSPLPVDPFTSAPFTYSERLNRHYSVGPDKKDDGAAIIYDATNGTVSTGDIWMESQPQ